MYSVVLMMALTTSAEVPDFCRGCSCSCRGCRGCHGCYSGCYGGCYGGGYGCCGGYGGGYGCNGGGYGCSGGYVGGTYGPAPDETQDEFAYCQQQATTMPPADYTNFRNNVWLRMSHEDRRKMMEGKKKPGGGDGASLSRQATIVVSLPVDARLTVDGQATTSTGTRRTLISPPLSPDNLYSYTLKADFVREGRTVSVSKRVTVSAGAETNVSLDETAGVLSASR